MPTTSRRARPGPATTPRRALAIVVVGALFLAACSGDDHTSEQPETAVRPTTPSDGSDRADAGTDRDEDDSDTRHERSDDAPEEDPTPAPVRNYTIAPPRFAHALVEPVGLDADDDDSGQDDSGQDDSGNDGTAAMEEADLIEVPSDEIDLGFSSPMALVEQGVELGVWDRAEGVIALLRVYLGEAPASSVEGIELVRTHSWTGLFSAAEELATGASMPDETAELTRLLDATTPDEGLIDAVVAAATPIDPDSLPGANPVSAESASDDARPTGLRRPARSTPTDPTGTSGTEGGCLDPSLTEYPLLRSFDATCWRSISSSVPSPHGGTSDMSVLYSEEYAEFAEPSLEALIRTVRAGHEWSTATTSSHLVIAPAARPMPEFTDDVERTAAGIGGAARPTGSYCFITMVVADGVEVSDAYRQVVAHEQVHCLQFEDYGRTGGSANHWFIEGGADYFSHVVYPTGRAEREHIPEFLLRSLTEPLMAMDYPVWVWWQYLGNRTSPAEVFQLHGRMVRGDPVEVLAAEPGLAEVFHDFTIELVRVGIPTMSDPVPQARRVVDHGRITRTGPRSQTAERFVAARVAIPYRRDHRFEQTDLTTTDGLHDVVPISIWSAREAWGPFPPEVRAGCDDSIYVMALTSITSVAHQVNWNIDEMVEDECDPCLVGTWLLDNDSFADTIIGWAEGEGGGMPPGLDIGWDIVGPYFLHLDAAGSAESWRNNWQMIFSGSAQGITVGATTTINSFETFRFTTDDGRIDIFDSVTEFSTATVETMGPGGAPFASATDTQSGAFGDRNETSGTYTCTPSELTIAFDEAPDLPIRWTRSGSGAEAPRPDAAGS